MTPGDDGPGSSSGRRTWLFVMAAAWGLLGLWSLTADQTVLGCMQLGLGGLSLLAALSPRAAAVLDAPVFRRK